MAGFDPNSYLEEEKAEAVAPTGFDPNAYASDVEKNPRAKTATGDAVLRGAAQGASLGFADELTALVGAAKDALTSPVDYGTAYKGWTNAIRRADDNAKADHPVAYGAGQVGGSLATTAVPGAGVFNAGKGAGLGQILAKSAVGGAAAGLGESRAGGKDKTMFGSYDALKEGLGDTATGTAVGAGTGGALFGLGKAVGAVKDSFRPSRVASVLLGAPEEAVERYIQNPGKINAAKPREQLTKDLIGTLDKFKGEVTEGSQASRKILSDEGKSVSGNTIADILQKKADDILHRSEGIVDDPQRLAALKFLQDSAEKYRGQGGEAPKLSTNRVKDLLQTFDRTTDYDIGAGRFGRVDDTTKKEVRSAVDRLLKGESPAYAEQMKGVAKDSALLNEVSDLAGTPQAMDNLLKRVQRDRAFFPAEKLKALDERMGTDLMGDLKDSFAKEAFDKAATNGSRNVNLYRGMLGDAGRKTGVPFAEMTGAALGATVDKYGPKMAKSLIDTSIAIQQRLASSEGLQSLGQFAKPLMEAAKKGNQALAVTHLMLMKSPEYASKWQDQ